MYQLIDIHTLRVIDSKTKYEKHILIKRMKELNRRFGTRFLIRKDR